jgi:hypothetical protein
MGISLNGLTPANTYVALLKIGDNAFLTTSLQTISDGLGNDTPLKLSTLAVGVGAIVDLETAINGKQSALSIDANQGLDLTSSALGTIYNTTISNDVLSIAVGGAPSQAASIWKTLNLVQVLDTILFPDILPTYTIPTISISGSSSGTLEVGTTVNQAISVTGVKNDAGIYTQLEILRNNVQIQQVLSPVGTGVGNIAPQFGYADPNNPNFSYNLPFTDSGFVVPLGSSNWRGEGNYNAGLPKQNNKGVTDTRAAAVRSTNAPQAASNDFSTGNVTITGLYRQFFGVSSTDVTNSAQARALPNNNFTSTSNFASGTFTLNKYIIAIPNTRNLVSVITVNNENITSLFVQTNINVNDAGGTPVAYKIFTFTSAIPLNVGATIILS